MKYEERGITLDIIRDMSRDKQLAIIVALDTIIGNTDRHGGNLIYNLENNSFCAIDMDDTFNKDLCEFDYKKFQSMLRESSRPFTRQELMGLCVYRDTLKKLLRHHSPHTLQKKFRHFIKQAGIVPGSALYTENLPHTIDFYEKMIKKSWKSAQKLVALLDKIVLIRSKNL
jgi:hypothetical protein